MSIYVAFLRGISPSNTKMHNENLRNVFDNLGFKNVRTVISSGNVLFETQSSEIKELEEHIEKTLTEKLGFKSTIIILSKEELELFVNRDPFKGIKDSSQSKLNVTFLKNKPNIEREFPYCPDNKEFTILCIQNRAICSIVDTTKTKTPDLMRWLENEFGKNITTRTWKTVGRIIKKLNET